jgi:hypothetical protein
MLLGVVAGWVEKDPTNAISSGSEEAVQLLVQVGPALHSKCRKGNRQRGRLETLAQPFGPDSGATTS